MVKEQVRGEGGGGSRRVGSVSFRAGSSWEMGEAGVAEVLTKELYRQDGGQLRPAPHGPLDRRLGLSSAAGGALCGTCAQDLEHCPGHFGFLDLQLPVFHLGYFSHLLKVLQCICKRCSHSLLPASRRGDFLAKASRPGRSYLERKALHKTIVALCRKSFLCAHCGYRNGVVKKAVGTPLKMVHAAPPCGGPEDLAAAARDNRELEALTGRAKQASVLSPVDVLALLDGVPEEELCLLSARPDPAHPRDMVLRRLPVPPAAIRPSVLSDLRAGTNEDDLTMKLAEIVLLNDCIRKHKKEGARLQQIQEDWDFLQIQCALYINSEISGLPQSMQQKKFCRSFAQRLKGKTGRFRGNLSGKRVDFSGRTVISPDPQLEIHEVGVPLLMAKTLTFPEPVTKSNINRMRELVGRGPDQHPGANFVAHGAAGARQKKFLKYGNRKVAASLLRYGDVVERHLRDGDVVLFNRQPSLHKVSIMAHRARVLPGRTLRFNECVCTPYNADFDGDEMNLHLPQTEEARAEAWELMRVSRNLVTPRSGEPLVAAIQDFITAAYVLTLKDRFFTKAQLAQLVSAILSGPDANRRILLPKPALLKPRVLYTGKQLFSLILSPHSPRLPINLCAKSKSFSGRGGEGSEGHLCPADGLVVVRNGELLAGVMDKATLGSGSKSNVFYVMMRDFGEEAACRAMWRLGRVGPAFLSNHGFSIGIGDVRPGPELLREKAALLEDGYSTCLGYIRQLGEGKLKAGAGASAEETLESLVLKELSTIRDRAGKACLRHLSPRNAPLIMAVCGSKGSFINISQMVACVGQQAISGKRPPDGFERRSLPHFAPLQKTPDAKGFVENSFYSGLTPTEFVFHTMAGREGLVDTAVKTAETGYMQRRLVKCLEDLVLEYDGTVRSSQKEVVEFVFGEDGLDPASMEGKEGAVLDLRHLLDHVRAAHPPDGDQDFLDADEVMALLEATLEDALPRVHHSYKERMREFLRGAAEESRWAWEEEERCERHRGLRSQTYTKACSDCQGRRRRRAWRLRNWALTSEQTLKWAQLVGRRWEAALTEPGTAVGAVAATSIGEPSTQMTLKTFHFAGVASMNITQGVPRIREIINAVKNISTPIISAALAEEGSEEAARKVKARLERTTLGQVAEFLEDVFLPSDAFLLIKLAKKRIRLLQLPLDALSVAEAICRAKLPVPVKMGQVKLVSSWALAVRAAEGGKMRGSAALQALRRSLPGVVVAGLPSVSRSVIHADESSGSVFKLLVEGTDLLSVMAAPGVDGRRTTFNNALEVGRVLGVEAARKVIVDEILATMAGHGIALDARHVGLLAELMTAKGRVLGMTRQGLASMKDSVLMLASFERTLDHLFEAAAFSQEDSVAGVSESIILGLPPPLGTACLRLLHAPSSKAPARSHRPTHPTSPLLASYQPLKPS